MPIYHAIVEASEKAEVVERLISAKNRASAVNKLVRDSIRCHVAEPDDIHRLAKAGIEIEVAADDTAVPDGAGA